MNVSMTAELAIAYKSGSQSARVVTESWGAQNLYCLNCSSPKLECLARNTEAHDFQCPACGGFYQLKSQRTPFRNSIADGAYNAMMKAIANDQTPNFYFMQYDLASWSVLNLLLVPHFAFPPSAIIKRKPLSPTARRAGWVGCFFALNRIPAEARIAIIADKKIASATEVRDRFRRVKPLERISVDQRGWALDVLNIVQRLGKSVFANGDVYAFERELEKLHPDNRHVRDKIRQQLQVLRDSGFLIQPGRGMWQLR